MSNRKKLLKYGKMSNETDAVTRHYHINGRKETETFDTFEEAVSSSYWGDEGGYCYTEKITRGDVTLWEASDYEGGVIAFAEDEGFVDPL